MTKKNIANIVSVVIIIVCVLAILISLIINSFKKEETNTLENNIQNEQNFNELGGEQKSVKDASLETFNNIFVISYLIDGDVKIGEGTISEGKNQEKYYAVDDYILKDIHSLSDIENLINDSLTTESAIRARKVFESQYSNKYFYSDDTLYVKKITNPCEKTKNSLESNKIEYREDNGRIYVVYDRVPFQIIKDDDGMLKGGALWFSCIDNFGDIGTGKYDEYVPSTNNSSENE